MGPVELTIMGYDCRGHRTFILKTLGPSKRKNPVQTILILLVESGLVFLGIQVSYFGIVLADMQIQTILTLLADSLLVNQCVRGGRRQ